MNNYTFTISDNINFEATKELIKVYKESLETGELYNSIIVNIKPNTDNINGEVDPIFLSYLFLYLADFKTDIEFNFKKEVKEGRYFSFRHLIRYFSYLNPDIEVKIKGVYFTKNIERKKIESLFHNRKENNSDLFYNINKTQLNKRFTPPIIINSEESIKKHFHSFTTATNKLEKNFLEFIGNYKNKFNYNYDLSLFEIYILRLLIQEDKKIQKNDFSKYTEYAKELNKGIKELADNIFEHSKKSDGESLQQGIITTRIYEKERIINLKSTDSKEYFNQFKDTDLFLDINIIDTGVKSVRQMYHNNINNNQTIFSKKEFGKGINFSDDLEKISTQSFKDFYVINIDNLADHQTNKIVSRYGLQYFTHILKERFQSYIKITSSKEKLDLYTNKKDDSEPTQNLEFGTSYNCIVPLNRFISLDEIKDLSDISQNSETPTEINSYLTVKDYNLIDYYDISSEQDLNSIIKINEKFIEIDKITAKDKRVFLAEIVDKFLTIPDEYRNHIFCINCKSIDLESSQWLRLLSVLTIYFKNLIIYNLHYDIISKLIDNRLSSYIPDNKVFKFWSDKSSVIFYSYKTSGKFKRFGATALTGETPNEYNYINKTIWNHRYSFKDIFALENREKIYTPKKINIDSNQLLFDSNSNLKFFELILKEDDLTLFEKSIQYSLNKNLLENIQKSKTNNKGYKIANTHFKLGSKIHIEDYFYAKRMFQNSFFTTPLSFLLAKEIYNNLDTSKKYTLVGYDSYSESLLSTTRYFLSKFNGVDKDKINHSTFVNNLFSKDLKSINDNIIIIIPIASTLFTSVKMFQKINELKEKKNDLSDNLSIIHPFYNILLVGDENFENKLEEELSGYSDKKDLYLNSIFKWSLPQETDYVNEIDIKIFNSEQKLRQKYFLPIYTKWNLSNNCESCYPTNFQDERVLNSTRDIPITPNLSFGYPMVFNDSDNKTLNYKDSLLYGNIKSKNNKFLYYIKVNSLINKNIKIINEFLEEIKNKIQHKVFNEKVVIISPSKKSQSLFINLLNDKVFNFTANCLTISIDEDFINNSRTLYEDSIYGAKYIIYVDDIFASAKSFNKINKLVSFIRNKEGKGIDLAITILNRLSLDVELNLNHKLNSKEFDKTFLYASRLFNPNIQEPNNLFPLDLEKEKYQKISSNSSLNAIKRIYINKSENLKEIDIEKIDLLNNKLKNKIKRDKSKQLIINNIIYSLFKTSFSNDDSNIGVAKTSTEITYTNQGIINDIFLEKDFEKLINYINQETNNLYKNDKNLKFLILKILTRPPIVYHKSIKESVFKWALSELDIITTEVKSINSINELYDFLNNEDVEYSRFGTLKFLIKRITQLGSNAVIHPDILDRIKYFIDFTYKIKNSDKDILINKINSLSTKSLSGNLVTECRNLILSIKEEKNYTKPIFEQDMFKIEINQQYEEFSKIYSQYEQLKFIENFKLKDFIYKYVGYVNELIFNHESKAVRLREVLTGFKSDSTIENGDFNHLIRLLKLENTASIESYWKEFQNKLKTKNISFKTLESLNNKTNEIIKNNCEDPKLKNIEELVSCEKNKITDLDNNSSFTNYLSLKIFITNLLQSEKRKQSEELSNISDNHSKNIKSHINFILEATSNIIGLKSNSKGGAFFSFNYKNKNENEITLEDIFQFDQFLYNTTEKDDFFVSNLRTEKSLTFKMFKGLKSSNSEYNISNFEVLKNNNHFSYREEVNINNLEESIEVQYCNLSKENYNIILISIRDEQKDITKAVLTYYINKGERISEDRLRLLLLLKTEISNLISIKYNNVNLVSYLTSLNDNNQFGEVSHLTSDIQEILEQHLDDIPLDKKINFELFIKDFLLYKEKLKEFTYQNSNINNLKIFNNKLMQFVEQSNLSETKTRERIELIILAFFKKIHDQNKVETRVSLSNLDSIVFYPQLLNELIIESIYNIRKYCKDDREISLLNKKLKVSIYHSNDFLYIENNLIRNYKNINIKKINLNIQNSNKHGLNLLNNIFFKLFNQIISAKIKEENNDVFFTLKIPLKTIL